jgi:signal transduction histidine kinase
VHPELVELATGNLHLLLATVSVLAVIMLATCSMVRYRWQLVFHLAFDVVWVGLLLHFTGGVSSPGVVLLFVIVLVDALVLPGAAPFVLSALGSMVMSVVAVLWLAGHVPFPPAYIALNPTLTNTDHIVGMLATQMAALFLVDFLGQLLAGRLREQRIFTGELLDQLGEGVLAIDRMGAIAYANAEAVRLLGLQSQIQGMAVSTALSSAQLAPALAMLQDEGRPALERFAGPNKRQLVLRVTQLMDRFDRPIGRTLLIADETRLKVLEDGAHLAAHLAALGEMAAGIAHEVRNPLTSLRGAAQELCELSALTGRKDAEALAAILVAEADRLARIVDDFLALSRLRAPEREPVDLESIVNDLRVLMTQRRDLPEGLILDFKVESDCIPVMAHADQLRQVFSNLMNNSLDALRQAPAPTLSVHITVADELNPLYGPAVEIMVSDNGCGIPKELHDRVFTPFFSTKSKGTGLGLSLVQRIIREHEGVLQLQSQTGHGTTITIFLPVHSQTRIFKRALGGG